MPRSKMTKASERSHLSAGEIAVIERLVKDGVLVAVPQIGSAKPRRVVSAALDPEGDRILLYLSALLLQFCSCPR